MRVNKGEKRIPGVCGWGQTREVEAIDFYRSLLARPREDTGLPRLTLVPDCKAKDVIKGGDDEGGYTLLPA